MIFGFGRKEAKQDPIGNVNDQIPEIIPLPGIVRPSLGPACSPSEVKSPSDLPQRLFLGSLVAPSFEITKDRWSVEYHDDDGESRVGLEYQMSSRSLLMSQKWQGIDGGLCGARGDDFKLLVKYAGSFPKAWDERAKASLEGRYNLQYLPTKRDAYAFTGFPDGSLKTLCCPVPVSRFRSLIKCHAEMATDSDIKSPIFGYLFRGWSAVNYMEGKNKLWESDPGGLFINTLFETGLPPIAQPEWETAGNGSRALTIRRLVYIYVVTFPFREINRLLSHLHSHGIVGRAESGRPVDTAPSAPEFAAVILQSGLEYNELHFNYFDPHRTRRVFYERFSTLEAAQTLNRNEDFQQIDRLLKKVETFSARITDFVNSAISTQADNHSSNPEDPVAFLESGNDSFGKGEYDAAIRCYSSAIKIDPNYATAYCNRGSAKAGSGDSEGAMEDYTRALELEPKYAIAFANRGNVYYSRNDYAAAIADYTRAIDIKPEYAKAYLRRGNAKLISADIEGAADDYRHAIRYDPESTEAQNRLKAVKDRNPLQILMSMPLEDRIHAIAHDVESRNDEFSKIDMEKALCFPPWNEILEGDDSMCYYRVEKKSLELYQKDYENLSDVLCQIEDTIAPTRFEMLVDKCSRLKGNSKLDFFTEAERDLLVGIYAKKELDSQECAPAVVVFKIDSLSFEAELDDDGVLGKFCSPYDIRDGNKTDFRNCVTKFLNDDTYFNVDSEGNWEEIASFDE